MKIKYCGGRSHYEVTMNRKSYPFYKANGNILETKDQNVINYIFSLDNRSEFMVVEDVVDKPIEDQRVSLPDILSQTKDNIFKKKPGRPKKG